MESSLRLKNFYTIAITLSFCFAKTEMVRVYGQNKNWARNGMVHRADSIKIVYTTDLRFAKKEIKYLTI